MYLFLSWAYGIMMVLFFTFYVIELIKKEGTEEKKNTYLTYFSANGVLFLLVQSFLS